MDKFAVDLDKVLDEFEKAVEQDKEEDWITPPSSSEAPPPKSPSQSRFNNRGSHHYPTIYHSEDVQQQYSYSTLNEVNSDNVHITEQNSVESSPSASNKDQASESSSQMLLIKMSPSSSESLVTVDNLISTSGPKTPDSTSYENLDPLANYAATEGPKTSLLNSASFEALFMNNNYLSPIDTNQDEYSLKDVSPMAHELEPGLNHENNHNLESDSKPHAESKNIDESVKEESSENTIMEEEKVHEEGPPDKNNESSNLFEEENNANSIKEVNDIVTAPIPCYEHSFQDNENIPNEKGEELSEIQQIGFARSQRVGFKLGEEEDVDEAKSLMELAAYLKEPEVDPTVLKTADLVEDYSLETQITDEKEKFSNPSSNTSCVSDSPLKSSATESEQNQEECFSRSSPESFLEEGNENCLTAIPQQAETLQYEGQETNNNPPNTNLRKTPGNSSLSEIDVDTDLKEDTTNEIEEMNLVAPPICNGVPTHPDHPPRTLRPTSLNLTGPNAVPSNSSPDSDHPSPDNTQVEASDPVTGLQLGKVKPFWIPDSDASNCMLCNQKFTVIKRRHHCRTCGKVLCSQCCNFKRKLPYLNNKEGRICVSCHTILGQAETRLAINSPGMTPFHGVPPNGWSPNPGNPQEYCSTIPPHQQVSEAELTPPTVMVPVGVLKRDPDSPDLDREPSSRRTRLSSLKPRKVLVVDEEGTLPPIILPSDSPPNYKPTSEELQALLEDKTSKPVCFVLTKNLKLFVKVVKLDCCTKQEVWSFCSKGLSCMGQDEVVLVLEKLPGEGCVPRGAFTLYQRLWDDASKGQAPVTDLGNVLFPEGVLGSRDHSGFILMRPTFQCETHLVLPKAPYLVALLIQRWETPWAKVFPLRLILRLGVEFRLYPCPLVSVRGRKPVYGEIGHTIINVLADLRNFQFTVPTVSGVSIHMVQAVLTTVKLPKPHYAQIQKLVSNSNDHVLAFGGNLSDEADSHIVCMQGEDGHYFTQAICTKEGKKNVLGTSFIVFSGALKLATGMKAKSSVVEDGLMYLITSDTLQELKTALHNMEDFEINEGPADEPPTNTVKLQWIDTDPTINSRVTSPIDGRKLTGVPSVKIHTATDYVGENFIIRWTEVFFIQTESTSGPSRMIEPPDPSRVADSASEACCLALTPYLDTLVESDIMMLGLRMSLDSEKVGYEIGASECPLPPMYMDVLDTALIPVISSASASPLVLELIFHIMVK